MKLSAVVIVRNEEKNLIDALDSISFCDEIVIVDDYSTDRTPEMLERLSKEDPRIKVYKRKLENDFSAQRQFGIEKTQNDWVLFIDADERLSADLISEIKESLSTPDYEGFLIPRIDFMWGKPLRHGETGNKKLLRLFNKHKGSLRGRVHETWETKSRVGVLTNPIFHYPHPTVSEFLKEINFYSDLRAEELYRKKVKSNLFSILLYTKGKFIKNYFFKLGFMDGVSGFVHATLMSFHSFLVRGKLWLLWQRKQAS